MMPRIDWKSFENAVLAAALEAMRQLLGRYKGTFYAAAFHEFYFETDGPIAMPLLAANTVEALAVNEDSRWSSADWKWTQIRYLTPDLRKLHRSIEKAAGEDEEIWQTTQTRFLDAFVKVAKALSSQLRSHSRVTKDFGVYVFIEDEAENEIGILRRCMTAAKFKKLFPQLQAQIEDTARLEASPGDAKLEVYRRDLMEHDRQILKLGERAIPMLREALSDPEQAWIAADLLAKIGIPDPPTMQVLKQRATTGDALAFHDTIALALLGEVDFLLNLARNAKTRDIAIRGVLSLYSVWLDWCQQPHSLDYRPLAQLLAVPGCKGKVSSLFDSPCSIGPEDVDEALRGLDSKHAVIREHAVCVLGERKLGSAVAARVLPALAARLRDKSATVRRLAILSLSYWKKAAKPYAADIRRLFKDPSTLVADYAKAFVKDVQ